MLWRIELFGGLQALHPDRQVTRFRTQKTGALLGYLALHLGRPQPRDLVLDLLWPDADQDAGRLSLRVALASLRGQLEPPPVPSGAVLIATRTHVHLNPEAVETDVAHFLRAVSDGGAGAPPTARALDLYRGELLAGYYDDWIVPDRERLAERYLGAVRQFAAAQLAAGAPQSALPYARRAVELDPLRESARGDLIRLLLAAGETREAARQYAELERLLRDELGVSPAPEIRRLAEQAKASPPLQVARPPADPPSGDAAPHESGSPASSMVDHPPSGASSAQGGLPLTLTRFFGRVEEVETLVCLLRPGTETHDAPDALPPRVVTLAGPGGSGKTRLSIEVARRLAPHYSGRVWFVPLADLTDPASVPEAVLQALRLPPSPNISTLDQLATVLGRAPSLLVLDNYEQLLPEGAAALLALLKRAPAMQCLVTSRTFLALPGERVVPLAPLPMPDPHAAPEEAAAQPCVRLFVDRAQAVRPDFQVNPRNVGAVVELCRRLEGVPLAIELAAARAGVLSAGQILERLGQRFELLATRKRDRAPRHQSLWAAVDWSYSLLSADVRRCFARLAIFRGGWTLESAEAVVLRGMPGLSASEVLFQLSAHSLVTIEDAEPVVRFRMLETLREYAEEQVPEEERAPLAREHAEYCLSLAERAAPEFHGPDQRAWLECLSAEAENLRAALAWSLAEPSPPAPAGGMSPAELGLRLAVALRSYWDLSGRLSQGREWLERLLTKVPAECSLALRADAVFAAGYLAERQTDGAAARPLLEEAIRLYRTLGDDLGRGGALCSLGQITWLMNHGEHLRARKLIARGLAICREQRDRVGTARALLALGRIATNRNEWSTARTLLEEAAGLFHASGNCRDEARCFYFLGWGAHFSGNQERARAALEQSAALHRRAGSRHEARQPLLSLAFVATRTGDLRSAREFAAESLALAREVGDLPGITAALEWLGWVEARLGEYPAAVQHLQEAREATREVLERLRVHLSPFSVLSKLWAAALGARRQDEARRSLEELIAFVEDQPSVRLSQLVESLAQSGVVAAPELAARLCGAVCRDRAAGGLRLPSGETWDEAFTGPLSASLGEPGYRRLLREGERLTLEEALELARSYTGYGPDRNPEPRAQRL